MVVKSPNNDDKAPSDVPSLIRGAEWIGVLKAFWTIMFSTFRNNGKNEKIENE